MVFNVWQMLLDRVLLNENTRKMSTRARYGNSGVNGRLEMSFSDIVLKEVLADFIHHVFLVQ